MRDAFDHLVNVLDLLCLLVVDLNFKLALKVEKNVEAIERVDTEGLEAAFRSNIFEGNALRGRDDFQYSILDGLVRQCFGSSSSAIHSGGYLRIHANGLTDFNLSCFPRIQH